MRKQTRNGVDNPHEYRTFPKDGCALFTSCLTCPRDVCIYDEPGGLQLLKRLWDAETPGSTTQIDVAHSAGM